MGQFLAIGLVVKQVIYKEDFDNETILVEDLVSQLQQKLYFNPDIYDVLESDKAFVFTLKKAVFESQLLPFLEKMYPLVYPDSKQSSYPITLNELKNTTADNWMSMAGDKSCEEFQIDSYGLPDYLILGNDFSPSIGVYYECILLSMEGKISMEFYSRQFKFFKLSVSTMFKEFSISSALRVYITG